MMNARRRSKLAVTDHAVLRFLERKHNVPVEAIRAAIAEGCAQEAAQGAMSVAFKGVLVVIENGKAVTVLADGMRPMKPHIAQNRRKQKRRRHYEP